MCLPSHSEIWREKGRREGGRVENCRKDRSAISTKRANFQGRGSGCMLGHKYGVSKYAVAYSPN